MAAAHRSKHQSSAEAACPQRSRDGYVTAIGAKHGPRLFAHEDERVSRPINRRGRSIVRPCVRQRTRARDPARTSAYRQEPNDRPCWRSRVAARCSSTRNLVSRLNSQMPSAPPRPRLQPDNLRPFGWFLGRKSSRWRETAFRGPPESAPPCNSQGLASAAAALVNRGEWGQSRLENTFGH